MLTLTLGDFTFNGIFECPQFINGGGEQALAVHKLIGGKRIVDAMGSDDDDIAWNGSFLGITYLDEAAYLDYLRTQGSDLILTYGFFKYLVKIKSFKFIVRPNFLADYSIVCTIVENQTQPVTIVVPAAFDETILNDLIEAQQLANLVANPSVSSALALLDAAVNAMINIGNTNGAALAAAAAAASSTVTTVSQALAAFNNAFGARRFSASNNQPNAADLAQAVIELEAQWQQYQALNAMLDTTTRMQRNIQIQSQPSGTTIVQQTSGNLYQLAVQYYNDPLQWTIIAEANVNTLKNSDGFIDPFIGGMVELIIPPKPSAASNGIISF